jgi:hypothetical protein
MTSFSAPYLPSLIARFRSAGIEHPKLLKADYDPASFGNGQASFEIGSLILRYVRDRGQEFIDLGSIQNPAKLFCFYDVEIAFGWRTIEQVIAISEPEPIETVLASFGRHREELERAFSGGHLATIARVEAAAAARGSAFKGRLESKYR